MKGQFIVLFLFLNFLSLSQTLSFKSDFEEKAFASLEDVKPDLIALMLAADGKASDQDLKEVNVAMEKIIQDLNPKKFEKYGPSKKIKKVFAIVQEQLLSKYELENQFADVFRNGNFNCVSATAVYAMCLERLGINYEIVEQPSHVYLIALPEDEAIVMESTDPTGGYLKLTEKSITDQLNALVALKVITLEELNSPDLSTILNELYPSDNIDFRSLVAIQYHNQSVYDIENGDYEESYQNALKADYIAPNSRYKAMMYMSLSVDLSQRDFKDEDYISKLGNFSKLDTTPDHRILVADEFEVFMYRYLVETPDFPKAESAYAAIMAALEDELLKSDLKLIYLQYKCNYLLKIGDIQASLPLALQAMELNDENLDVIALMNMSTASSIDAGYLKNPVDSVRSYTERFPSLADNKLWLSMYCNVILLDVFQRIKVNKVSSVMPDLLEFEKILAEDPDLPIIPVNVGAAYSRVALKQFNYSKSTALSTINRGLRYAPDNPDLLRLKRAMQ